MQMGGTYHYLFKVKNTHIALLTKKALVLESRTSTGMMSFDEIFDITAGV